ncbi:MAG: YkgJ family cysteine cluster protein [Thiohalomonadaceae bacterium]
MKIANAYAADLDRLETWVRYRNGMCRDCRASCCTMPTEVRMSDLLRLGLVDAFEAEEPRSVARRLTKEGIVERYNARSGIFTLARLANGDCIFLERDTRRCSVYENRPDTCRNHPQVGPRPGFCAYAQKVQR